MSVVAPGNVIRRLRHTPLRDLVRGRVTGRLDVRGRIEASGLPGEVKELVWRVVRRTRLWVGEKVEVADELIAHFADGLEGGASAEELKGKFGDEKKAARLIRRAKKRGRPMAWHVLRGLGWMVVGVLVIYAGLAARFLMGRPVVKVDYLEALNRGKLGTAVEQRAWPIYRRAVLGLGDRDSKAFRERFERIWDARPGSRHWEEVGPWLREREKVVELAWEGAEKPVLGFVLGPEGSIRDEELYPGMAGMWEREMRRGGNAVWGISLPYRTELAGLANILAMDARLAREQGDGKRVMRDVEALVRLGEQLHREGDVMANDMWGMAMWAMAMQVAGESVAEDASKLSDEDLRKLAHLLSRPRVAADFLSLRGERMMFEDAIQRAYTDDGKGDGHFTGEGQKFFQELYAGYGSDMRHDYEGLVSGMAGTVAASRREVVEYYDAMLGVADANFRRPMREADWSAYKRMVSGAPRGVAYILGSLSQLVSGWRGGAQGHAERALGERDGLVVGIALELYRRKFGEYPAKLEELVPRYLPEVPADRITGEGVRYRLVNGKPVVYSVGDDRKDDGGRVPVKRNGKIDRWGAAMWNEEKRLEGDWVLYPQVVEMRDEEE